MFASSSAKLKTNIKLVTKEPNQHINSVTDYVRINKEIIHVLDFNFRVMMAVYKYLKQKNLEQYI